jgi:hypothetical protein
MSQHASLAGFCFVAQAVGLMRRPNVKESAAAGRETMGVGFVDACLALLAGKSGVISCNRESRLTQNSGGFHMIGPTQ